MKTGINVGKLQKELKLGLGSAITEINKHPDNDEYRSVILDNCLKNSSYDIQSEGSRGFYLYDAIKAHGDMDYFIEIIIDKYSQRLSFDLAQQLTDILFRYAYEDHYESEVALSKKYSQLMIKLTHQKNFSLKYGEREQFEYLAIIFTDLYGLGDFQDCIYDMGKMILARGNDDCLTYNWLMSKVEDEYKVKAKDFLENSPSVFVKTFYSYYLASEDINTVEDDENQTLSLSNYLLEINKFAENNCEHYPVVLIKRFTKSAKKNDLIKLAKLTIDEENKRIKAYLLRTFVYSQFPLNENILLKYLYDSDRFLANTTADVLGNIKSKSVHDIGIKLLEDGKVAEGLTLLIKNWKRGDDTVIYKSLRRKNHISHAIQMAVVDLYSEHKSSTSQQILEYTYYNGPCAFCREGILEDMIKNKVVNDSIIHDCPYDCYDETRTLARKYKKQQEKKKL